MPRLTATTLVGTAFPGKVNKSTGSGALNAPLGNERKIVEITPHGRQIVQLTLAKNGAGSVRDRALPRRQRNHICQRRRQRHQNRIRATGP
jgi:hypothetical protein